MHNCEQCGKPFDTLRARYCSSTCRANKTRGQQPMASAPAAADLVRPVAGLTDSVRAELEVLGKLDTVIGLQALELAARMVSPMTMAGPAATLSKELSRVLGEARGTAATAAVNPLDELRARRDKRRAG